MIAPPSVVPCPPTNFVKECTTTSAPCSIGLRYMGVAIVLSTISGTPWLWASVADGLEIDDIERRDCPTDSQKIALVLASMSGSMHSGRSPSAKRTWIPEPRQDVSEERVGGPVELWRGDDIVVRTVARFKIE
jgi:hypothetical protein